MRAKDYLTSATGAAKAIKKISLLFLFFSVKYELRA